MKRRNGVVAILAVVGFGLLALAASLYLGSAMQRQPSIAPSPPPPISLQANQTFEHDNRIYDEAAVPIVSNQQYRLDGITFTYLGNSSTATDASQCPPAYLKPFNDLYQGNEIKHFSAILKNGTKVNLNICWPIPRTPPVSPQPSKTGHGVSTILQKRGEWRWFDPDSKTAGILQDKVYFLPGNTTFYYLAEKTGP